MKVKVEKGRGDENYTEKIASTRMAKYVLQSIGVVAARKGSHRTKGERAGVCRVETSNLAHNSLSLPLQ
jgi:hypothetical protein